MTLAKVTEFLGNRSESFSLKFGHHPLFDHTGINHEERMLIHDLVIHIHKNEPDIEKSILVFLPTYHDLEQLWFLMKCFTTAFKIHILHSRIDTKQTLRAMKIWKSHRKLLIEVDNLQDVPSPYLQIKGVNKEIVVVAGLKLKLEGSYTTKVVPKCHTHINYLQIIMERLPVLERSASGIRTQQATRFQELVDFIQTRLLQAFLTSQDRICYIYNPEDYADLLIKHSTRHIL